MTSSYPPRLLDAQLSRTLQTIGAVLIEGPKLCGKSTTAAKQARSAVLLEPDRTLKLVDKIDVGKMSAPSFLMVLTASGEYAFRRDDGVLVVPIGCLAP